MTVARPTLKPVPSSWRATGKSSEHFLGAGEMAVDRASRDA